MLVRFLGFSIETPVNVSLEDVMTDLASQANNYESFDDVGRFFFADTQSNADYHLGLIVTVKSQKTFCELRQAGRSFKVQVNKVDGNSNIMEFNFFVINKITNLGLYQQYHQSCSIGQGLSLLKRRFNAVKERKRREIKEAEIKAGKSSEKAEKIANQQVKGYFKSEIIIRKDNLQNVLAEFKKIKALEIDFSYLEPDSKEFGQLSSYVKKQRRKFSFSNTSSLSSLIQSIVSVVNGSSTESGRVFGVDDDGLDRIIKIQNNPDNFGEFDYDEIASYINDLDVSDFQNSLVIKSLIESCEKNSAIFKAKTK